MTGEQVVNWSLSGIYKPQSNNEQLKLSVFCYSSDTGYIKLNVRTLMATQVKTITTSP